MGFPLGPVFFVGLCAGIYVLTFAQLFGAARLLEKWSWGTVPDWALVVLALLAGLIAGIDVLRSRREHAEQLREMRDEHHEQIQHLLEQQSLAERALAAQTSPYLVLLADHGIDSPDHVRLRFPWMQAWTALQIRNIGSGPAIRITVHAWIRGHEAIPHTNLSDAELDLLGPPNFEAKAGALAGGDNDYAWFLPLAPLPAELDNSPHVLLHWRSRFHGVVEGDPQRSSRGAAHLQQIT